MIRCVVFDLWNTLVRSEGGSPFQQVRALLDEGQRAAYPELVREGMRQDHATAEAFLASWRERLGLGPDQERAMAQAFATADAEARLFPETLTALDRTRELGRLALLSNTQRFDLALLGRLGLDPYFRVKGLSAELGALKPEPEIFERMQQKLGLFPGNLVMVGDSWTDDVEGALAAGWTAIWVNRKGEPRPEHDPEAELVEVDSLDQVPVVVERLQAGMRCSTCLG
ncbi:MAG TPA: HAD family hydrolase [Holophagaceae bacterium]|nr:HAD family hydrolase [Holophagaceae bacterium]